MKFKDGKKGWFIASLIIIILMLIGTIGSLIVNKKLDSLNLIIIFILVSNMSNLVEKK